MNDEVTRFYVFNDTDGILASTGAMTLEQANHFIRCFPNRFAGQGYYLTARRERISPESVVLRLINADSDEGRRIAQIEIERE